LLVYSIPFHIIVLIILPYIQHPYIHLVFTAECWSCDLLLICFYCNFFNLSCCDNVNCFIWFWNFVVLWIWFLVLGYFFQIFCVSHCQSYCLHHILHWLFINLGDLISILSVDSLCKRWLLGLVHCNYICPLIRIWFV